MRKGIIAALVILLSFAGCSKARTGTDQADSAPRGETGLDAAKARGILEEYYSAINAGDYRRAFLLWGDSGRSSHQTFEDFRSGYAHTVHVDLEVGPAGRIEGAAGSRFVEIPVAIVATADSGMTQRFEGTYTLRRVVVDGASEAQRRWHLNSASLHSAPPVNSNATP